jgi:PTH1 family peptidyl-tRNA hydrolase
LPKEQLSFQTVKLGALAEYKFKGTFFFLKPNTYMNLSGTVQYWMDKENISQTSLSLLMI